MHPFEVVSAAATRSPKGQEENEDRAISFVFGPEADAPGAGVVVCDGVGALADSAAAAAWAARVASDHVMRCGVRGGVWSLPEIWEDETLGEIDGATTMVLLAAEATGVVAHAMIGNGSVFEIVPTPLPSGAVRLLWTDVALPQIDWSEGKPALSSVLPVPPAGLRASRGAHLVDGERMYALCSDGISTLEERPNSNAPDDTVWRQVPVGVTYLLETLTELWGDLAAASAAHAREALHEGVEQVLTALENEPGLDDDASLGVVFVRPVERARSGTGREEGARHA